MIKVFYYYYYLFYQRILKDNEPHLLATLGLCFVESFLFIGIIDFIVAKFFCQKMASEFMYSIMLLLVLINYLYFHRTGLAKEVVKEKPNFLSSHTTTVVIVLISTIIVLSWLYWGSYSTKTILSNC